jgi:hypothetical protein
MNPLWHPATGKLADSKSEFRKMTREAGCYEVGNDIKATPREPPRPDRRERREAIERAIYELRNAAPPETDA